MKKLLAMTVLILGSTSVKANISNFTLKSQLISPWMGNTEFIEKELNELAEDICEKYEMVPTLLSQHTESKGSATFYKVVQEYDCKYRYTNLEAIGKSHTSCDGQVNEGSEVSEVRAMEIAKAKCTVVHTVDVIDSKTTTHMDTSRAWSCGVSYIYTTTLQYKCLGW